MSIFNFNIFELFTFFMVLVRFSVILSVLPLVGDRMIPLPIKILMALAITFSLFPALVASGQVHPSDAKRWAATSSGIAATVGLEVLFALALGFTARLVFDGISFGSNLIGNFMGFASASMYDPHQESQTQVVAQIQTTLAMLIFLASDGHHLMLRAALDSYRIVGLGKAEMSGPLSTSLIKITGEIFGFGLEIAGPVSVALFAVNVVFGLISKAVPQVNVFMLSFAVSALVGLGVLFLSVEAFHDVVVTHVERMIDWMVLIMQALKGGG